MGVDKEQGIGIWLWGIGRGREGGRDDIKALGMRLWYIQWGIEGSACEMERGQGAKEGHRQGPT